ncbi:hypothetical protein [Natrinema salsiterrestre]|uniref:Uncharacterized protein n=1 Tax=Natrinema salsiterrestre TaxID=2950540 RepID=A0A9Q4Q3G8_9EURY|nr:hypothetical protein [Natrinema salsiterrestre]MDF9747541.1 hypothetical protein [Natrinema salsiterrestre]
MSERSRRQRRTVLRTVGALGAGAVAAVTTAGASTGDPPNRPDRAPEPESTPSAAPGSSPVDVEIGDLLEGSDLYVGVVDRIVDGEHVVLLLEDGEEVVDQLVLPVDRFDDIEPDDILLTAATDGELHAYRRVPSKPNGCPDPGFEPLPSDD